MLFGLTGRCHHFGENTVSMLNPPDSDIMFPWNVCIHKCALHVFVMQIYDPFNTMQISYLRHTKLVHIWSCDWILLESEFLLFYAVSISCCYILHRISVAQVVYFPKICYHTQFQDLILSATSFVPTSQTTNSRDCHEKYVFGVACNGIKSESNLIEIY